MAMLLMFVLGIVLGIVINPMWFLVSAIAVVVIAIAALVD